MPIRLYNKDTGKLLGDITDAQLKTLVDLLVEESDDDRDYYIDRDTLEMLAEEGADEKLIAMIKPLIGDGEEDGVEIEWRRE